MTIRVLVIDDSAFMRSMLSRMIAKDDRFEVVGQAKNGQEGLELAKSLKPDLVTLDIEMPVMDGLTALKLIMKEAPTRVIMVSSLTTAGAESTLEALENGAVDFIPKAMEGGGQNILQASALLIEKLLAAAGVSVRRSLLRQPSESSTSSALPKKDETSATPARPSLVERALERKRQEDAAAAAASKEAPKPRRLSSVHKLPSAKLIVLGSSTGGPRALQDFLPHLPANLRVPVVIAQHMPAAFTGPMAQRLNSSALTTVVEGQDGDVLKPGHVYIAPGGVHARVVEKGGQLVLSIKEDTGQESVYKPSVDILAQSASDILGGHVLAIMLTGMGSDGSKGFASLKTKGSYVLAQDEETSVVYGMPKSVKDIADEILPLGDIAGVVKRLLS